MSMQICKEAYQELIDGDIEWLLRQPRDLERDHIDAVFEEDNKDIVISFVPYTNVLFINGYGYDKPRVEKEIANMAN